MLAGVVERKLERACQLVRLDIQPSTLLLFLLLLLLLLLLLPLLLMARCGVARNRSLV